MEITSSPSFGLTVRVELEHKAGRLAAVRSGVARQFKKTPGTLVS